MNASRKLWYLENFNLFKSLDKETLTGLSRVVSDRKLSKNDSIDFDINNSPFIYFLKDGKLKLSRLSNEGKEMIISLLHPGEIFGEMSIFDETENKDYAVAIEECVVCSIESNTFKELMETNPKLNLEVTKLIGLRLKKFSNRIEELFFLDARQRVISFLLSFAEDFGEKVGVEIFVKPFLTHQNIAELTACSRQTVNSILTELRDDNIIYFDRRKLIIRDEAYLKNELK